MDTVYDVVSGWSIGSQTAPRRPPLTYCNCEGDQRGQQQHELEYKFKNNSIAGIWRRNTSRRIVFYFFIRFKYFIDAAKEISCLMILL